MQVNQNGLANRASFPFTFGMKNVMIYCNKIEWCVLFFLSFKVCQNANQRQETVQEAAATENTPLIAWQHDLIVKKYLWYTKE